ncbi:MAG: SpoIID/LytB domain-containing protein [Elusimicrobiota bacterium]
MVFSASSLPSEGKEAFFASAYESYRQGNLEEAVNIYQQILAEDRECLTAHLNLGILLDSLGRKEESLAHWRIAGDLDPANKNILGKLGWANYFTGDFPQAKKYFAQAIEVDQNDWEAHLGLARCCDELQEWEEAEKEYYQSALANPHSSLPFFYLAQFYEQKNLPKAALAAYQLAKKCDYYFWEAGEKLKKINRNFTPADQLNSAGEIAPEYLEKIMNLAIWGKNKTNGLLNDGDKNAVTKKPKGKGAFLQVGLFTTELGRKNLKKKISFLAQGGEFVVKGGRTGKIYFYGNTGKKSKGRWRVEFSKQTQKVKLVNAQGVVKFISSGPIIIEPETNNFDLLLDDNWKSYRGKLKIVAYKNGFILINIINVEDYLHGVVPVEMITTWPMEALKAQAVMSRSLALYMKKIGRAHRREGYDLCDSQHCQVYRSKKEETPRTRLAVESTRGKVLLHKGKPVNLFYSSNCGGVVRDCREMDGWGAFSFLKTFVDTESGTPLPCSPWEWDRWLRENPKVVCKTSEDVFPAEFRWARVVTPEDFLPSINRKVGRIAQIIPLQRGRSGRVNSMKIIGDKGEYIVSGDYQIRKIIKGKPFRSTFFVIDTERGKDNKTINFVFWGGGWGHGVGFCQSGAAGLASQGKGYQQILKYYFPDLEMS